MNQLLLTAFDLQPTPVLLLSDTSAILAANRACTNLFSTSSSLVGLNIQELPIKWQDGPPSTLAQLLTTDTPSDKDVGNHSYNPSHSATPLLKLQVEILKQPISASLAASLNVTGLVYDGKPFRVLAFENITSLAFTLPTALKDSGRDRTGTAHNTETSSYAGTSATDKSQNEHRFSKLCDAIYHSDPRSGFLLSADATYCYPNYNSNKATVAVEIDDLELFVRSFDLWDPHFTRRLDIPEYPTIWLHRNKTKFRNRRVGLIDDGQKMVMETAGDPLYDPVTGEFVGSVVWVTPLGTPAEVVASDLEKSLSDFENICDQLPHLLWTVTPDGSADYFSKSWYSFTGLTRDQSLGTAFTDAIHPADMQTIWESYHTCTISRTQVNCEARYRRHDGEWRWMNVLAKPLLDANGNILKWYGSSTDIDSLVKERDRANNRKDQLMDMLKLADVGIFEALSPHSIAVLEGRVNWLKNKQGQILDTNTNGEVFGEIARYIKVVLSGEQPKVAFEAQIESRWYKIRLLLDKNMDGQSIVLGCSIDITEQKERDFLEIENQRLTTQTSLEVEKSRLKTMFLAHMSHEIRTPIAGIIGIADILVESKLQESQAECVHDIQFSANNLLTIVNDILDFSKIEADQLVFEKIQYDLIAVILEVKKLLWRTAKAKSLTISCTFDTSAHLELTGDPGRVRQILANLVSNAIKFTPEGAIEISVDVDSQHIQVSVRDRGQGIDQETMSRLFRPFVQGDASTARRHGGTGLGLTISRHLANGMGGRLELTSEPGKGTNAVLTLPNPAGAEKQWMQNDVEAILKPPVRQPTLRNIKLQERVLEKSASVTEPPLVLIVEDNAINQKVAVNLVRKLGYTICTAWNGLEALNYLEKCLSVYTSDDSLDEAPTNISERLPALILMDCQMPMMDGYEATNILRTDPRFDLVKSIPIVALTASAIIGDREKCQAAGMDDYMSKPVTKAVLETMLRTWIPAK